MANTKSALKNIRKNKARYLQNRATSSRLKTLEKKFLAAVAENNPDLSKELASSFISALEKATKSNLVHANKVSRKKSRCAELISGIAN
jgi:small subunit ribosomal protein S20